MNKKLVNRLLSLAMAAAVSMTSVVPSYAANPDEPVFDETEPTDDIDDQDDTENGNPDNGQPANPENTPNPDNTPNPNNTPDPEDPENTPNPEKENPDDVVIPENTDNTTDPLDPENVEGQEIKAAITVEYSLNGGMLNEEDTDKTSFEGVVGQEMTISLSAATFENMEFAGWYTTADYSDTDFVVTENTWTYTFTPEEEVVSLTFYASFVPKIEVEEEEVVGERTFAEGELVPFTVVTGEGGTFYYGDGSYLPTTTGMIRYGNDYTSNFGFSRENYDPIQRQAVSQEMNFFAANDGYDFIGLYADSEYTIPIVLASDFEHETWISEFKVLFYSDFPSEVNEQIETTGTFTVYARFEKFKYRLLAYSNNGKSEVTDIYLSVGDKYPAELGTPKRAGYTFKNWQENYDGTKITPGVTEFTRKTKKYSDGYYSHNYWWDSDLGCYVTAIYAVYTDNTYTVNYHLNNTTKDVKVTKTYTGYYKYNNLPLDIMAGDLSANSSFDRSSLFLGWALSKDGDVVFDVDDNATVGDLVAYIDSNNGSRTIDLYAQWSETADDYSYTVAVKSGVSQEDFNKYCAGSKLGFEGITQTLTKGEAITLNGDEYVREGYTLTGWTYYRGNNPVTLGASGSFKDLAMGKENETVTLVPHWTPDTYTITYNANGGKISVYSNGKTSYVTSTTQTYNRDTKTVYLIYNGSVKKTGYKFTGWRTDDGRILNDNFSGIYENLNLTAQWELIEYTVNIYGQGGFTSSDEGTGTEGFRQVTLKYGEEFDLSKVPFTYTGHTFKGFTSYVNNKKVTYAANAKIKNLVTEARYYSDGPYTPEVNLYAEWDTPNYTITYNLNGGKATGTLTSAKYSIDNAKYSKIALPNYVNKNGNFEIGGTQTVTRDGYKFAGWKAGDTYYTYYGVDIYANLALVAQWTPIDYTLKVVDEKDTDPNAGVGYAFVYDQAVSVESLGLTKNGYKLVNLTGTVNGKAVTFAPKAVLKNLTTENGAEVKLTSHWVADQYTITYNLNGGKVDKGVATKVTYSLDTEDIENGVALLNYTDEFVIADAENQKVTRDGYTFDGWKAGDVEYTYYGKDVFATLTLVAQWTPITYTLKVVDETGLIYQDDFMYDESVSLDSLQLTRTGYKLNNFTSVVGTKTVTYTTKSVIKNATKNAGEVIELTANWTPVTYTVTYNLNGGKTTDRKIATKATYNIKDNTEKIALLNYTVADDSEIVAAEDQVVTRTGYTFEGWTAAGTEYKYYAGDIYENLTLVAQWAPVSYTVEFYNGDYHYEDCDVILNYDESFSLKNVKFTKFGYKFKNYTTVNAAGKTVTYSATGTIKNAATSGTVKLNTNWTLNNYTVTYALDGGKLPKGKSNKNKYTVESGLYLNSPEKAGYEFVGWDVAVKGAAEGPGVPVVVAAEDGNYQINGNQNNYGNIILTAKWKEKKYNFVFVDFENNFDVDNLHDYQDLIITNSVNFNEAAKVIDGGNEDKSLKGFATSAENAQKGKVAYNLTSSYALSKVVNANQTTTTLYAVWGTTKTYHISYANLDGAKLNKTLYTYSKNGKADQALPTASKAGYVFGGWEVVDGDAEVLTADGKKIAKDKGGDITIKPIFKPVTYEVWVSPNAKDVTKNGAVIPNTAWKLSGDDAAAVTYDGNAGVFNLLEEEGDSWVRTGYTFDGFATSAKGKTAVTSLAGLTTKNNGKVTLYAIWIPETYTISYDLLGYNNETFDAHGNMVKRYYEGHELSPATIRFNSPYGLMGTTVDGTYGKVYKPGKMSLAGYTFNGWVLADPSQRDLVTLDKKGHVTSIKATNTSDITLRADFSEFTYKIVFNANGGTIDNKTTMTAVTKYHAEVSDLMPTLLNATKKGYTLRCVAYDKAGKNPVIYADGTINYNRYYINNVDGEEVREGKLQTLSQKNNATVTLYAIWDKVSPSKVAEVTAVKEGSSLKVTVGETASTDVAYQIQYSTNAKFTGVVEEAAIGYDELAVEKTISDLASQTCYVRVRKIMKDSTGADVAGAWSATVRATKSVN